jgi:hypothetical protein
MDLDDYQREALTTSTVGKERDAETAVAPLLGLASGVGSLQNAYKRFLRDKRFDVDTNREFLKEEIGDVLWYTAVVSASLGFKLSEISDANLKRTRDRYGKDGEGLTCSTDFDKEYPEHEQFPRQLLVEFKDLDSQTGPPKATMTLIEATPNAFKEGPRTEKNASGKSVKIGYEIGMRLGDPLDDNSMEGDGYRFHDAIHFGILAVLGWSPTMRALLRLKRRSNPETLANEDNARAVFLEEGIAAALAELSKKRDGFTRRGTIDGKVLDIVKEMASNYEVARCRQSAWREAIYQGFAAYAQLVKNNGGVLVVDLDQRTLTYSPGTI